MERETSYATALGWTSEFNIFKHRSHCRERTVAVRPMNGRRLPPPNHPEFPLSGLPTINFVGGIFHLGREMEDATSSICRLVTSRTGLQAEYLVFNPLLAERFGWTSMDDAPLSFVDDRGEVVVRTELWRDGWPQEMQHVEGYWATGQSVVASPSALRHIQVAGLGRTFATYRYRSEVRDGQPARSTTWSG